MNYAELLSKYIEHVSQSEGANFLDRLSDVRFTEAEIEALHAASRGELGDMETVLSEAWEAGWSVRDAHGSTYDDEPDKLQFIAAKMAGG
ncbi:TPA: hypothetical protein ACKP9G_003747 [Pseudomonas aeruginosa]